MPGRGRALAARDWRGLRDLNARTGLSIIADESLVTCDDLGAMPAGESFIPNFRVSKLGGLIRSADLLRRALAERRKIIVGAQVGETSILARAGLALIAAAGPTSWATRVGTGRCCLRMTWQHQG